MRRDLSEHEEPNVMMVGRGRVALQDKIEMKG